MLVTEILEGAAHAVGIRTGETPKYEVIHEDSELEIRRYAAFLVAKTFAPGDYETSAAAAFKQLADYIGGRNVAGARLYQQDPPALNGEAGEHMPMTTPVLMSEAEGGWAMSFILPRKYSFSTAPRPTGEQIELEQVPSHTMAVLRYTGGVDHNRIQRKFRELRGWVQSIGWRCISEPIAAHYDPPFTIPFLKRNEVLIRAEALHS